MFTFQVDGRDGYSAVPQVCNTCCAEVASAIPGESNKWRIDYSPWLVGISGRGLIAPVEFSFLKLTPNAVAQNLTVLPPTNTDYQVQLEANVTYNGTVATNALSPQSSPLTFALDPVNPPEHGIVAMNANGSFIYVPTAGYTGLDDFSFLTTDGINPAIENSVQIGVDTLVTPNFVLPLPPGVVQLTGGTTQVFETPLPPDAGLLFIPPRSVYLKTPFLEFRLTCSPETMVGQVYRLTIATKAMECDGDIFRHISTYDILITKCQF